MRSEISQIDNFQYIAASKDFNTRQKHVNAPLFRKQFRCDGLPEQAILRVACVGLYLLYVNGTEITKGYLAPYISNCNDTVYYDEYDITPLLLADADNVVCVILGNGFANAIDFDIWQFESSPFRRAPCFALTLTYNGKQILQTDVSFELYDSAIMFDDIRAGERYDARLRRTELFAPSSKALPGCKKPIIVETPHGELRKCNVEPIREQRRFSAQRVISSRDGYIYDFGENNAGVVCLRVNGESGQKITFDFGEVVIDGKLNKDNIVCDFACDDYKWDYVQHDEYICTDGWQTWTPSFTYHGFRYVYVTGLTSEQATIDALQCIVLHSDVKQRGNFRCSNQTLNRIYDIRRVDLQYTTDNERVATVVDGKIVAVDAGTTKVRGTYKESGFIINVTVDKPVFEVVATNGVVEVGRLADVAFDIRLEGSLVSATIGNAQVGKSITDGMLTLDREKLEAMPVANYGEHVALFIETNLVKYSTEIELTELYITIADSGKKEARLPVYL